MDFYIEKPSEDITKQIVSYNNPLVIYTQNSEFIKFKSISGITLCPWWDLEVRGYFKDNCPTSIWLDHEIVIFLDPRRSGNRLLYYRLINIIRVIDENNITSPSGIL